MSFATTLLHPSKQGLPTPSRSGLPSENTSIDNSSYQNLSAEQAPKSLPSPDYTRSTINTPLEDLIFPSTFRS